MAAVRHLEFLKFVILVTGPVSEHYFTFLILCQIFNIHWISSF